MESTTIKYATSPNKDRTLDNVLIDDVLIVGPHKLQHANDLDMTFDLIANIDNGRLMEPMTVSDFAKQQFSNEEISNDYNILDNIYYESKAVKDQELYKKEYSMNGVNRNRYSDIITYIKTRVKLKKGVDLAKAVESDYINACFVNSPFPAEGEFKGDAKIIAS